MAKPQLIDPDGVGERLRRRYQTHHRRWLEGEGPWPLSIPLGSPSERDAREHVRVVKAWQARWNDWKGLGELVWSERQWPSLGTQKLPERILLHQPGHVAHWVGEAERWQRAKQRYADIIGRWPQLIGVMSRHFDQMADYEELDFRRLFTVLDWLESHPQSGLYVRQLPVEGVDTKWLSTRKPLMTSMLSAIRGQSGDRVDLHEVAGLCREPALVRLRLLDPTVCRVIGGLSDITASPNEIARLELPLSRVYIVENLQTGLAFQPIGGTAVFMGLGYAVDLLGLIPWIRKHPCFYWGDLDTHGFAILNRLRSYLPQAQSVLMDEATLMDHKSLWGEEDRPVDADLVQLTATEQRVYRDLCQHRWGLRIRLEQERIPWVYACKRLCEK